MSVHLSVKVLRILILLLPVFGANGDETDNETPLKISNSVATNICTQHGAFQEEGSLQSPVKQRPENDDTACGWFNWKKCDSLSSSDVNADADCPAFTLKSCDSESGSGKKGRTVNTKQWDDDECDPDFPDMKIVSPANKYPSIVAIHRGENCYEKKCWGGIINEEWIVVPMTTGCFAAFSPEDPDYFHLIAGDRQVFIDEGTEQPRSVLQFIPHPDFRPVTLINSTHYKGNLGLVRLDKPLEFNEDVQPIDLTAVKELASTSGSVLNNLQIVSWPQNTGEDDDSVEKNSQVEIPVEFVPDATCYNWSMEQDGASKESLICAGECIVSSNLKLAGPFQGFLFTFIKDFVPVPVGIGPIRHRYPEQISPYGVFTDLLFYLPWIEETIQNNGDGGQAPNPNPNPNPNQTTGSGSGRVVGGADSPPHKYPSMINLHRKVNGQCTSHACGGAILSPDWIVTAAHCLTLAKPPFDQELIILGDHDNSIQEETEQYVQIEKLILHENYGYDRGTINDIAVVKVSPPIKFNENVAPVKLPQPDYDPQGPFQAIGWGLKYGYYPHILQEVQVPLVSLEECAKMWAVLKPGPTPNYPKESDICIGTARQGICGADSGSPLYEINEAGEQVLIGILSYGGSNDCNHTLMIGNRRRRRASGDWNEMESEDFNGGVFSPASNESITPGVYMRVPFYIPWIRKNTGLEL